MDARLASMPVIDVEVGRLCEVEDTLGGLDPRVQRRVLYETAERVYKLDVLGRTGIREPIPIDVPMGLLAAYLPLATSHRDGSRGAHEESSRSRSTPPEDGAN